MLALVKTSEFIFECNLCDGWIHCLCNNAVLMEYYMFMLSYSMQSSGTFAHSVEKVHQLN